MKPRQALAAERVAHDRCNHHRVDVLRLNAFAVEHQGHLAGGLVADLLGAQNARHARKNQLEVVRHRLENLGVLALDHHGVDVLVLIRLGPTLFRGLNLDPGLFRQCLHNPFGGLARRNVIGARALEPALERAESRAMKEEPTVEIQLVGEVLDHLLGGQEVLLGLFESGVPGQGHLKLEASTLFFLDLDELDLLEDGAFLSLPSCAD